MTVENAYMDKDHIDFGIEEYWITDIKIGNDDISLVSILKEKRVLSNDLFIIKKLNSNKWNIEFTRKFVQKYRDDLSLAIELGEWGWDEFGGVNFRCDSEIAPYEYIFLTNKQLQVIRNAYYARYGYIFKNTALKNMYIGLAKPDFGGINYRENPDFTESTLTEIDRANIETIKKLEAMEFVK